MIIEHAARGVFPRLEEAIAETPQKAFGSLGLEIRKIALELGLMEETKVQTLAIQAFFTNENLLIIAPTGSGKTEAALLPIFHEILSDRKQGGIRALYVTPLRALNRDMLGRITRWGERLGISVQVRHGDTPQKERRSQSLRPPEILITTPETLQVLLMGSRLRQGLKNVEWVVVDEIHQLAQDRRGAQLSIGLERLQALINKPIKRLGLSATVSNKQEIAQFLAGAKRSVGIVDESATVKDARYRVEMPESDEEDFKLAGEVYVSPKLLSRLERISDLIRSHQSTLLFVNSRTNAEYLATKLISLGTKVGVHHGSLPREERERVESDFKSGKIPAMVCTSTLELGIDVGSVDLVIQYMSPRQVCSMVQRVGRSGHSLSKSSEGVMITVSPEDALESVSISRMAVEKRLERTQLHESPLDVLAHQVAGILLESRDVTLQRILDLAIRAYPFRSLESGNLASVLKYMETLGYLRFEADRIIPRRKCREYYLENLSMIPDERRYTVVDATTQDKVGILGEEFMLLHAQVGLNFVIKGRAWKIESIGEDLVYVTPVQDPEAAIPGWDGELLPIPETTAREVGKERRNLESKAEREDSLELTKDWNADRNARSRILDEVKGQKLGSSVPTDKKVVVEGWKRFLIVHTSAGDRINLTLGELFEETLLRRGLIRHWWSDGYRILIELTTEQYDLKEITSLLFHYDTGKRGFLNAVIRKHFPFGYYLKFVAERFGALKRGLMLSSDSLKDLTVKFRFTPIYEETLREALMSKVDVDGSLRLLEGCESGSILLECSEVEQPSPLGMYILSRYAEMDEYEASGGNALDSMKSALSKEVVSLLCFKCATLVEYVKVGALEEVPRCPTCNSGLIAPVFYAGNFARSALLKKLRGGPLSKDEDMILMRARRAADLVLSYGRQGILAQCVFGIGPQTASRVLSKMHSREDSFYEDLLAAKLNFIRTREYWD